MWTLDDLYGVGTWMNLQQWVLEWVCTSNSLQTRISTLNNLHSLIICELWYSPVFINWLFHDIPSYDWAPTIYTMISNMRSRYSDVAPTPPCKVPNFTAALDKSPTQVPKTLFYFLVASLEISKWTGIQWENRPGPKHVSMSGMLHQKACKCNTMQQSKCCFEGNRWRRILPPWLDAASERFLSYIFFCRRQSSFNYYS